ncbi:putative universal stress protein [Methanocella paludicola SANAE]|uniref:Universal stress protein n=1 Tax=Methanocella paludicola (strain DSM 17711 / JCM 13418 / NBRC 101707 / SANAE) TaxID=304371 RepID=D1YZK2_METPS|nr:universal stress protein [Methanocella paludicola]BAI61874.1 putative universal stress protein [Methanocella paludicola SANAE]
MSNKIQIATDGSKYSQMAVDYGISMAKKLGASVIALYVVNLKSLEMYALGHHDDIGGYTGADAALKADGEKALAYVSSKCREAGVGVSTRMVRGYPSEEIIKLASSEGVDMIVVGNLGKTGLEHLLLGSVSEAIVKKAPCPVLVVRGSI